MGETWRALERRGTLGKTQQGQECRSPTLQVNGERWKLML